LMQALSTWWVANSLSSKFRPLRTPKAHAVGHSLFCTLSTLGDRQVISRQPFVITAQARRGPALPVGWVV
jgi:hypothetical protein